jgi:hypothetical protein
MSTNVKASVPVIATCICGINAIILLKRAKERGFAVYPKGNCNYSGRKKWGIGGRGRLDSLAFPDQESQTNPNNQWLSWLLTIVQTLNKSRVAAPSIGEEFAHKMGLCQIRTT